MACNILRYFKLYCIMFCKVCKKLKWSFLTFFDISIHAEWDNYNNFNKVLVNHDLIRFTQYIHVHYTSLRETRPYNFFHLNLHQGLLQTFLTSLNVELLYFCVFVRKTICNTYSIIFWDSQYRDYRYYCAAYPKTSFLSLSIQCIIYNGQKF